MKYLLLPTIVFLNFVYNFGLPLIEGTGDADVDRPADPVATHALTLPASQAAASVATTGDDPPLQAEQLLLNHRTPLVVVVDPRPSTRDRSRRPWGFAGARGGDRRQELQEEGEDSEAGAEEREREEEEERRVGHGDWDPRWRTHGRLPPVIQRKRTGGKRRPDNRDYSRDSDASHSPTADTHETQDREEEQRGSGNRRRVSDGSRRRVSSSSDRKQTQKETQGKRSPGDEEEDEAIGRRSPGDEEGDSREGESASVGAKGGSHAEWDRLWQTHGRPAAAASVAPLDPVSVFH